MCAPCFQIVLPVSNRKLTERVVEGEREDESWRYLAASRLTKCRYRPEENLNGFPIILNNNGGRQKRDETNACGGNLELY